MSVKNRYELKMKGKKLLVKTADEQFVNCYATIL